MKLQNKFTVILFTLVIGVFSMVYTVNAQTNLEVMRATLSLDFEKVDGKIFAVGDTLVFVDDDKPENSFAIEKDNIEEITKDDSMLTIRTKRALKNSSGERSRFAFRLKNGNVNDLVSNLNVGFTKSDSDKRDSNVTTKTSGSVSNGIYEVKHPHRLYGGCTGRIIIGDDRISYESSDEREHSRQWLFADIKKLKSKSPYKLDVKLFKGDGYSLEVLGQGIDIKDFKALEDKLAATKAKR